MAVIGIEILNQFPFNKLHAKVTDTESYKDRSVEGWGNVHLPSLSGEGMAVVWSKDRVEEYVEDFYKKFGEEPVFQLNPNDVWFNRTVVTNTCFLKFKEEKTERIRNGIKQFGTAE